MSGSAPLMAQASSSFPHGGLYTGKRKLVACGMMDPNTFLFSEEMILAERMKAIKRDVYFYPAVTILHEHNQTISKFIVDKKKFMLRFESECYYYRTYRNVSLLSTYIGKLSFQFYL